MAVVYLTELSHCHTTLALSSREQAPMRLRIAIGHVRAVGVAASTHGMSSSQDGHLLGSPAQATPTGLSLLLVALREIATSADEIRQQCAQSDRAHDVEPDVESVGGSGADDSGEERTGETVKVDLRRGVRDV